MSYPKLTSVVILSDDQMGKIKGGRCQDGCKKACKPGSKSGTIIIVKPDLPENPETLQSLIQVPGNIYCPELYICFMIYEKVFIKSILYTKKRPKKNCVV